MSEVAAVAARLVAAERVVVVPGHGLAIAQAQRLLVALVDALAARGAEVDWAAHPAAGRFPGHLAFLLERAGVPSGELLDPAAADAALGAADLVLVVGAHDVVDPGLPFLTLPAPARVVVVDATGGPGYAGRTHPEPVATTRLLGDLEVTLRALLAAVLVAQGTNEGPTAMR